MKWGNRLKSTRDSTETLGPTEILVEIFKYRYLQKMRSFWMHQRFIATPLCIKERYPSRSVPLHQQIFSSRVSQKELNDVPPEVEPKCHKIPANSPDSILKHMGERKFSENPLKQKNNLSSLPCSAAQCIGKGSCFPSLGRMIPLKVASALPHLPRVKKCKPKMLLLHVIAQAKCLSATEGLTSIYSIAGDYLITTSMT